MRMITRPVGHASRAARLALAGGLLAAGMLGSPAQAGSGCPAGTWERITVTEAAATIYPHLFAPPPGGLSAFEAIVAGDDRDGDGLVCLKAQWGEALNASSHWARLGMAVLGEPTHAFIVHDNTAGATD